MPSCCGENIKVSIFGQSHSEAIGVVVDGLPAGKRIDLDELAAFLGRRAPGKNEYSTARKEADMPEILSGLIDGHTCGAPLAAIIRNTNQRSGDYDKLKNTPRPGHADFTAQVKYHGAQDARGGGHFSGRLTAPLCIAGGICIQLLAGAGIEVGAHIASIANVPDEPFDPVKVDKALMDKVKSAAFPTVSETAGAAMREAIAAARAEGDSVGGVIECAVVGLPVGVGDAMFGGLEGRMAQILFGVPAVKGLEFGAGFAAANMRGSENNDPFVYENGEIRTAGNNHGGILGGISSGMPVIFRAAIKPTPSIGREQDSVDINTGTAVKLDIGGRHDPCIVPRAVPCIEAAAAIAVYDAYIDYIKEN
ncbi:MAG: chorismate synthase [Clostridiales bacterium]|nr:chorismate synthase [Clostridiales bacterium]